MLSKQWGIIKKWILNIHCLILVSSFGINNACRVVYTVLSLELWLKGLVGLMRLQHCDSQTLTGDFGRFSLSLSNTVSPSLNFLYRPAVDTAHRSECAGSCCRIHFLHAGNCLLMCGHLCICDLLQHELALTGCADMVYTGLQLMTR